MIEGLPEAIEVDQYLDRLFPIPRSLTGNGNRKTLRILQQIVPLKVIEYPSGTSVYDWTIPDERATLQTLRFGLDLESVMRARTTKVVTPN